MRVPLIVCLGLSLLAAPARAQSPVTVKWNNGLSIESADGDDKLQLGTLLQVDGRFAVDDPAPITDTFLMRRARILLQGRVSKYFEFNFVPDFANGSVVLLDGYLDVKFSDALRVRFGKNKTPVGLEQLQSDATLPMAERSIGTGLTPNRDVGITAFGDFGDGRFSYVGGVMNGIPDGANGDADTSGGKDLVGRATVRVGPFGAAVGASHGDQSGSLPAFKSTAQQTFFAYAPGAAANGTRNRVSPAAFVYYKSGGGFAEYFRTTQAVARDGATRDLTNSGWNVTGIVVLTGEPLSERGASPSRPFDPENGRWGGLQLAGRVSSLRVDPTAFASGLAAPDASRTARAVGVSLIWYNTGNVKDTLTYEHTVFDGDANGPRKAENAVIFRVQINLSPSL